MIRPCLDCGTPAIRTRCTICQASRDHIRNLSRGQRYGQEHRELRRHYTPHVNTGTVLCARCGERITGAWDLDHLPDGTSRPSHAVCNRTYGGRA